jgi:hypothetical protein
MPGEQRGSKRHDNWARGGSRRRGRSVLALAVVLACAVTSVALAAPPSGLAGPRAARIHYCNSSDSMFVRNLHNISGGAACVVAGKLFAWLKKPGHRISRCTAVDGPPVLVTHSWEGYRLSINRMETLVLTRKHTSFSVAGDSDAPIGCS